MAELDHADRRSLRAAARDYLASTLPDNGRPAEVDPAVLGRGGWRRLCAELGLSGVSFAEDDGGTDLGPEAELLVHEELGRVLSGAPYLSTVAAVGSALRVLPTAAAAGLRQSIVAGDLIAAAVLEPVAATDHSGQLRLGGEQECVIDAAVADALLVVADRADRGPVLAWVATDAPGVSVTPLAAVDLTRRFARVRFDSAPASVLAEESLAAQAVAAAQTGLHLGLAAESIGAAARALELTVEYVKVRHQFGRAIGSFQAVKHLCAEMLVQLEEARSALAFAARMAGQPDTQLAAAALAVARTQCGDRCAWVANEAIHLHGGIGFTWEHPAHLYFRRVNSNRQLLDPRSDQRQLIAELVAQYYAEEISVR